MPGSSKHPKKLTISVTPDEDWDYVNRPIPPSHRIFIQQAALIMACFLMAGVAVYFLLPLFNLSPLLLLAAASASLGGLFHFAVLSAFAIILASLTVASLSFLPPFAEHLKENSNRYLWQELPSEIFARTYQNDDADQPVSLWQILNLVGHLYLLTGGLQLLVNKAAHQLYNYGIDHVPSPTGIKIMEYHHNLKTNIILFLPRVILAPLFILLVTPLNLLAPALALINSAVQRTAKEISTALQARITINSSKKTFSPSRRVPVSAVRQETLDSLAAAIEDRTAGRRASAPGPIGSPPIIAARRSASAPDSVSNNQRHLSRKNNSVQTAPNSARGFFPSPTRFGTAGLPAEDSVAGFSPSRRKLW